MYRFHHLITRNKYFLLLLSLLVFFITSAIIADLQRQMVFFAIFFAIVLVFSVYIIEHNKKLLIVGSLLAAFIAIGNYLSVMTPLGSNFYFILIEYLVSSFFFIAISIATLMSVMHDRVITSSTLYGAICSYLLIGMTWSFVYMLIYQIDPNAFTANPSIQIGDADVRFQNFIYYSFVTLSTLGYGDMTPAAYLAKTSAWLESVIGQIYLTVWIARLVGLSIAHGKMKTAGKQHD